MDNPGTAIPTWRKKWAVRISYHGEFMHENEENRANLGKKNTSHGCINLSEVDAKKYFDGALVGNPIEVVGSASIMEPRYDVYNWLLSWQEWTVKSKL